MGEKQLTEYDLLLRELEPLIEEKSLDRITVRSLLLSSVEIDEPEMGTAQVAVVSPKGLSKGKSLKLKNVKIGLKLALNSIFAVKTALSEEGCWLILCILKIICSLVSIMTVEFEKEESAALFAVYRLRSASSSRIIQYIDELKETKELSDIDTGKIESALEKLEEIGTIELVDGEYRLMETVIVQ